ncbi:MAG TPA: chloride channel protein [Conexivisphaerales archaeon]|nr:chloride channel protein [Conexivisphaerales archaeon]
MSKNETVGRREESRIGLLALLSGGIGFVAGFIAFFLYHLIGLITNLLYYGKLDPTFVSAEFNHLGLLVVIVPALGGLVAGLMIRYGSSKIIGHGIPEAMESVLLDRSRIRPRVGALKALSAAVTIGSGQPFGAEGPIIQTGGAFGSFIGQLISLTGSERKILLASGAAAGMAATFGTPLAAVVLVVELLLFEFRVKSLVPVGIAAAIGGWMHIYLITPQPLFQTPPYDFGGLATLPFYVLLGLLSGLVGAALSKGLYRSEDAFLRLPFGQPWSPAIGGLAVGAMGFLVPQILGVGYGTITGILVGQYGLGLVALIMAAKAVAWLLSMGSQTSGGTLAPLFMVGSSLGVLFGSVTGLVFPAIGVVPGVFGVAAMAAVFGAASRAPFTSVIFALEVTQDFQGVLPVIITVVIAELVDEYLTEDSIMTEKLARRGLRVRHIYEYNPLRQVIVSALMSKPVSTVQGEQNVLDLYREMNDPGNEISRRKRIVVMKKGRVVGTIERSQVYDAASHAEANLTVEKACSKAFLTVREDELAYQAQREMILHNVRFLIVVDRNGELSGYLSLSDLVRAQKHKIEDETIVERGILSSRFP